MRTEDFGGRGDNWRCKVLKKARRWRVKLWDGNILWDRRLRENMWRDRDIIEFWEKGRYCMRIYLSVVSFENYMSRWMPQGILCPRKRICIGDSVTWEPDRRRDKVEWSRKLQQCLLNVTTEFVLTFELYHIWPLFLSLLACLLLYHLWCDPKLREWGIKAYGHIIGQVVALVSSTSPLFL